MVIRVFDAGLLQGLQDNVRFASTGRPVQVKASVVAGCYAAHAVTDNAKSALQIGQGLTIIVAEEEFGGNILRCCVHLFLFLKSFLAARDHADHLLSIERMTGGRSLEKDLEHLE
jgi:hypothetical protein